MKKLVLLVLFINSWVISYAQKGGPFKNSIQYKAEQTGHGGYNELKINLFYSAVWRRPEISYERLLNKNMGIGASVSVALDSSQYSKFAFTPHYRLYFGAKKVNGFFIEANTCLMVINTYYGPQQDLRSADIKRHPYRNRAYVGYGAVIGAKFLIRKGFVAEAYAGLGELHVKKINYYTFGAYERCGITLGKRF